MTYDASERSLAGGAPVELYTFVTGAITRRYTSADADIGAELAELGELVPERSEGVDPAPVTHRTETDAEAPAADVGATLFACGTLDGTLMNT